MSAYSEGYLGYAMENMGEMLEYAEEGCGISPEAYLAVFSYSTIGREWGKGNPVYICGRSGSELCMDVLDQAGAVYQAGDTGEAILGTTYWCGWILAYYQWSRGDSFQNIYQDVKFRDLMQAYPAGHTASEERACDIIDAVRFGRKDSVQTRLQMYRQRIGLSQSELAAQSGVNLRTLQEYEVGRKSIRQASAEKVLRLARALHTSPESLLEMA